MKRAAESSGKKLLLFACVFLVAVGLDQLLKYLVVSRMSPGESARLIPGVLKITYSTNTGAAFGLFKGSGQLIFLAALVVLVLAGGWFLYARHRMDTWAFVAMGLVLGGAVGNLIDRVFRGRVVDFLDLGWWPVFNVADIAIVAGVIIFAVGTVLELRADGDKAGGGGGE